MRTRSIPLLLALAVAIPSVDASGATPIWTVTGNTSGALNNVSGSKSGAVVAVVGGNLVASKDFGVTWTPVVTGVPGGGSSQSRVAVTTPTRWFAQNGGAVSLTTDAGTTWRPITPKPVIKDPKQSFEWAEDISAADGSSTALVGWGGARVVGLCPYALDFTPMFTTHNAGKTWRRTDIPVPSMVWSSEWLDTKRGAAVLTELEWSEPEGDDNSCESRGSFVATSIWVTSDGGTSWRRVLRSPDIWYASAAWASPTSVVVIGEKNGVGMSYVSKDAGRSFPKPVVVYDTTPWSTDVKYNGFPALDFADPRRGWVETILSGVYRTDNSGTEWIHEVSPADGGFYAVPDIAVMNRDRVVVAGPWTLNTRHGDAPAGSFTGPVVPSAPQDIVSSVVDGALRRDVTLPAAGPLSVRVSASR